MEWRHDKGCVDECCDGGWSNSEIRCDLCEFFVERGIAAYSDYARAMNIHLASKDSVVMFFVRVYHLSSHHIMLGEWRHAAKVDLASVIQINIFCAPNELRLNVANTNKSCIFDHLLKTKPCRPSPLHPYESAR